MRYSGRKNKIKFFERFIKLNNFAQGTGLGLSICKSIVDAMGGEIGVDSKVGNGSTFWFTLPYHTGTANESTDKPVELSELSKDKQITILIAEDDESNYRLFHSILQKRFSTNSCTRRKRSSRAIFPSSSKPSS